MKVANSLKTLKTRDRNCRIVRRKGRVYVINKVNMRAHNLGAQDRGLLRGLFPPDEKI